VNCGAPKYIAERSGCIIEADSVLVYVRAPEPSGAVAVAPVVLRPGDTTVCVSAAPAIAAVPVVASSARARIATRLRSVLIKVLVMGRDSSADVSGVTGGPVGARKPVALVQGPTISWG